MQKYRSRIADINIAEIFGKAFLKPLPLFLNRFINRRITRDRFCCGVQ